jgi:hypothetical protein
MSSFASVVMMLRLWSQVSGVCSVPPFTFGSFQASHRPAKAIGSPFLSWIAKGVFLVPTLDVRTGSSAPRPPPYPRQDTAPSQPKGHLKGS